MGKQREEFEKLLGNEFDPEGIYWEWFKKGQSAMQPDIDELRHDYVKGLESALSASQKEYAECFKQLSAANQRIEELLDKQREADFQVYWKKKHHVGDEKMQREIFNHGHKAAQAAMQPEIDKLLHENNKFMWQVRDTCTRAEKAEQQLSAANQRIEELLDLVEVVERRNKQLEERIRVADAEEPVAHLHDCGEFTWRKGANEAIKYKASFAGWKGIDVYAAPVIKEQL